MQKTIVLKKRNVFTKEMSFEVITFARYLMVVISSGIAYTQLYTGSKYLCLNNKKTTNNMRVSLSLICLHFCL